MFKEVETTIAEVELDGYALKFEGILDEKDWTVTMSFKNDLMSSKSWKLDEYVWDEADLEEKVWAEVLRITQKYSCVTFSNGLTEVEEEDFDEE